MLYHEKVSNEFATKVKQLAKYLQVHPNWLMLLMYYESASTFSPSVKNKYSGATGLIQFMPKTAIGLGTTTTELAAMSAERQLDYVKLYLKPYRNRMKSFFDLYGTVFFPLMVGKPDNYVLETSRIKASRIATQNPQFDRNNNGVIKKSEIRRYFTEYINESIPTKYHGTLKTRQMKHIDLIKTGLILILTILAIYSTVKNY